MARNPRTGVECYASLGGALVASQSVGIPDSIRFGEDFEFDLSAYRLSRSGRPLKLERIPAEVLALLLEHRGELVTREQLVESIWGKGAFLDTDNSINGAIRKVRQVLKDDPEQPRFIQTITGKGYRFIAPVRAPVPGFLPVTNVEALRPVAVPSLRSPAAPVAGNLLRGRWPLLLGIFIPVVVIAGLALGIYSHWSRSRIRPAAAAGRAMLAVLPFENLTGDASQDYFSDGLTEEMISQLGDLDPEHMGVIARTSVMQYKHTTKALDQIGRELGVQYALEGSVRSDSGKLRISAQLIELSDQTHLWTRQYDREPGNVLALQSEIAQETANEIRLKIGDHERIASGEPPMLSRTASEAYVLYLKGLYFSNKRTTQGLQQAIRYFQKAVDKDPAYAQAYAGLAQSYALMAGYGGSLPTEAMPRARAAAHRALELDERLPEAHSALAVIAQNYDWDWATAEKQYRRAIQLNPNYATAHHWYAECLALQGRFNEAFREIESARKLDPLSLIVAADYGAILYFSRQYDRAIEQFRAVLEMEPNFPRAHMLVWAYAQKGQFADALADLEAWRSPDNLAWTWAMEAYLAGMSGDRARAKLAFEQLQRMEALQPLDSLSLAITYIGMGDNEKALARLEKAYLEHSSSLSALKVDPTYDPLRADPRFQELLRRLGLAK
jgi:TolB-like protein/DNA-binding winged helix-turn-helix (wHTH) protein/Tfp pilus assembly protein PilF